MTDDFPGIESAKLMRHLAVEPLQERMHRKLFGGTYIRYSDVLQVSWLMYETGAVIGRARAHRLRIVAQMLLADPKLNTVESLIEWMQTDARAQWEKYDATFKKEPDNFMVLVRNTELAQAGLDPRKSDRNLHKALNRKLAVTREIERSVVVAGVKGIGFGSVLPEFVAPMCIAGPGRRRGEFSFETHESQILKKMTLFISRNFPDLMDPLGLKMIKGKVTHADSRM